MAHTNCPSGHSMWNGDGKTTLWIFRVGYFYEYTKQHPDFLALTSPEGMDLYDCFEKTVGEDIDGWICDICKGVTLFVDNKRYDFMPCEVTGIFSYDEVTHWEKYIVLRDWDFEDWQEFYEGKTPVEAIEKYRFNYLYYLSPDKRLVCAVDASGSIAFAYRRVNYMEFSFEMYVGNIIPLKYGESFHVWVGAYAEMKEDFKHIRITGIIDPDYEYSAYYLNDPAQKMITVKKDDLFSVSESNHYIDVVRVK